VAAIRNAPAAELAPPAAEPAVADDPAPQPAAVAADPVPAPVKVTLMSSRGFCFPSLDDEPVTGQSQVRYLDVTPGRHRVYCDKQLVGEIEVHPGPDMVKRIMPGPDGKPHF
jgi:hypothetical protein